MKLRFTKMHGAGNDFVVVDGVRTAVKLSEEQIRTIANRHTGVGCDQVLIIEPPKRPDADFEYRIFNADEQCLALGTQLRTFKINDYKIYRIFPSGEVQYLHPKDGVFPEKVNPGRTAVVSRGFSIGKNPNPASIKFSGTTTYES